QAPCSAAQFSNTYELMSRDEVYGTMWRGASNSIAYFLILVMMPLLGVALRRPDLRWPRWALAVMLVPFVLSSSRGAYLLFPILFLAAFSRDLRKNPAIRSLIAWGAVAVGSLFAVYYLF